MKDLQLTQDGDLYVDQSGDIQITDSVRQAILIRLRWFLNEWRFRPDFGVPYYEHVLVKNPNQNLIRQLLTEQILSVEEVTGVPELSLTLDAKKRSLKVSFAAETTKGRIQEEVTIGAEIWGDGGRI